MPGPNVLRYPRPLTLQGAEPMDVRLVFVEEGGVRIDNAGPFSPAEVVKLYKWLGSYLRVASGAELRDCTVLAASQGALHTCVLPRGHGGRHAWS